MCGVLPTLSGQSSEARLLTVAAGRRIALIISSLNYGGAEMQATVLANGLSRSGRTVSLLVSYSYGGALRERVSADVRLHCLGRRSRWDVIRLLRTLFLVLAEEKPDVLYAFLPGANLAACLAKLRFPQLKVTWGVRASNVELGHYDWGARLSYWLERRFSRWPQLIISNSVAGRRNAVAHGFPDNDRFIVIPNGIDVERFRPDPEQRKVVRAEWRISPQETLVGIVGRLDPMKDHATFLEAAAKVAQRKQEMRFVSIGTGPQYYATLLRERACGLGLDQRMIWAGPRSDLPAVYNALDLLVSSSAFGEGFSNVLGEAMACSVPCVATDVGDAREILGEDGLLVPPRDSELLAMGILRMVERIHLDELGIRARLRQRVVENFEVEALVRRTNEALEAIP
jgi:glycosyltransferase involved in cell wall biosynthesis